MAEYYEKINWKDGTEGGTPLSAENLNKMEEGISGAEMRTGPLEYDKENDTFSAGDKIQLDANGNLKVSGIITDGKGNVLGKISDLVQITGNSELAVMSQKATTDAIIEKTEYDNIIEEDITNNLTIEDGYHYTVGLKKVKQGNYFACTSLIPVKAGDKFKITATYGYITPLVAEFNSEQTMVSYSVTNGGGSKAATDYEYTVPENVSFIAINNRDQRYDGVHNLIKVVRISADDVKRRITNNQEQLERLSSTSVFATNQIAPKSEWMEIGGTLTFDGNTAIVTPSKSSIKIGIATRFGNYDTGDTIFFKVNIKAPFGVGGSVSQNAVLHNSNVNTDTGLKFLRQSDMKSIEETDYYGNITFDNTPNTNKMNFIVQYNSVNRIPDNARIKIKNLVAVNLTKVFGLGNEPTAEEFYSLLDGFENRYFEGEVNLFGASANWRRIYNDYKSSLLTTGITVSVGANGDFETLNAAINYLSAFYPAYKRGGIKAYINILADTVINEQIFANQIDLQYITIVAEAGEDNTEIINIDGTNHTMVIVPVDATGFFNTANAHDARGNYPFIAGENAAKLPTIGCVFRLMPETVESGKTVCGMLCNRGSEGVILAASGFDGFNDGVIANNESSITIREGISRNMTRWGVHARHNGEVSARSCICTNCGIAACADRVADLDVREAVLDGSTVAIECNNISRANANGCHARNCGSENGYVVTVSGGGIANCGSFETMGSVGTVYNISTNTLTANGIIFV